MFRTEILFDQNWLSLDRKSHYLLMGSCFAEHIGNRLSELQLKVNINPTGIAFNPASIAHHIMGEGDPVLIEHKGIWHSLHHHSSFSSSSKEELQSALTQSQAKLNHWLNQANLLTISFGTAFAYIHKDTGVRVANCHKIPASNFDKVLMTSDEITQLWQEVIEYLLRVNPGLQLLFTVSPVRHIKDGILQNTRSKARLIEAVHAIVDQYNHCHYFPSYEIMMDDLRDYRFYADDLLHPSAQAIDYIFDHWKKTYCNASLIQYMKDMEAYRKLLEHRPRFEFGEDYAHFQNHLVREKERISKLYPENILEN